MSKTKFCIYEDESGHYTATRVHHVIADTYESALDKIEESYSSVQTEIISHDSECVDREFYLKSKEDLHDDK